MKRPQSAIGVSMLDLISNALAATLILFFVLSILRLPPIPPTRILGTLVVRCSIHAQNNPKAASVEIWLQPPPSPDGGIKDHKFGERIEDMNEDPEVFGLYGRDYSAVLDSVEQASVPPHVVVYAPVDSPNVRIAIVRDPIAGTWTGGILYVNHEQFDDGPQKAKAIIEVWFVKNSSTKIDTVKKEFDFVAPTESRQIQIKTPDWLEESS